MKFYKMKCFLAAQAGEDLGVEESAAFRLHLAVCPQCAARARRLQEARTALRRLPTVVPPAHLLTSLRVMASRERVRRLEGPGLAAVLSAWIARTRFQIGGLMRPFALPTAGGLASTVMLFALLAPSFATPAASPTEDVPTVLSTAATFLGIGPFGYSGDDITLELTVDSRGRVVGYSSPKGEREWLKDPAVRRNVENMLMFAAFTPGTTFGRPAAGKVTIKLSRSYIDVRG
jgi:hypothetical protein